MTPGQILPRLAVGLIASAFAGGFALAAETHPCKAPNELTHLTLPLTHMALRLAHAEPVTVVAMGSSSTAGAGASSKAATYPSRLETDLQAEFPFNTVTVVNRGVNGEEMPDMLARFDTDVVAAKPDLVLWQLGTNSVLRSHPLEASNPMILEGVRRIKAIGADVVMIDPQFAPKVIAKPEAEGMVKLISASAKQANVDLIQRFAIMRYWHDEEHMAFSEFISPDDLHMNDWSYDCLARLISGSITEAATRGVASAAAAVQPHHIVP